MFTLLCALVSCHTANYTLVLFLYSKYEGKAISKLQIQVANYVSEISAGNCHRSIAALSSFIVTHNDRYVHV
jgi:hypothetical protein